MTSEQFLRTVGDLKALARRGGEDYTIDLDTYKESCFKVIHVPRCYENSVTHIQTLAFCKYIWYGVTMYLIAPIAAPMTQMTFT